MQFDLKEKYEETISIDDVKHILNEESIHHFFVDLNDNLTLIKVMTISFT
jgi:hypothetical protein